MSQNRTKPTIGALRCPSFGWTQTLDTAEVKQWESSTEKLCLSVHFFNMAPDLISIVDVNALRYFLRDSLQPVSGGLIEVNVGELKGLDFVKFIFKVSQGLGQGIRYQGVLTFPFENCSYVVKLQGEELGITGVRDSTIFLKESQKESRIRTMGKGPGEWFRDPYHPTLTDGILMNLSEQEKYDVDHPTHPLSRIRTLLKRIASELTFAPELNALPRFNK